MLKKIISSIVFLNCVFAYDHSKKTGPMPGVMINRKVATAKQTLLNRQVALDDGDANVIAVQDDDVCVELKKNPFINNSVDDNRYDNNKFYEAKK